MTRMFAAAFAALTLAVAPAFGAGPAVDAAAKSSVNPIAIAMFIGFVMLTLGITYWAAKRTRSASHFYTAGGGITGLQNDLAIAGDYMSAATSSGSPRWSTRPAMTATST